MNNLLDVIATVLIGFSLLLLSVSTIISSEKLNKVERKLDVIYEIVVPQDRSERGDLGH